LNDFAAVAGAMGLELSAAPPQDGLSPGLSRCAERLISFVEGVAKLGTKPHDVAERLPPPLQMTLPHPDRIAREALIIVTP
jgi:hypothetical protein